MRNRYIFVILVLCTGVARAQNFSGRTNDLMLNFNKAPVSSASVPTISWVTPRNESTSSTAGQVDIEAEVRTDIPLKSISIIIGSNSRGAAEKKLQIDQGSLAYKIKQSITLPDGQNEVSIVVSNDVGGTVSSSRYILVGKDLVSDAIDINRKDYALIFATNKYDDLTDLVNPVDDARAIEKLLKDKYGFVTEFIEDPLYEEVYAKISEYNAKRFNPQDQLFIFFAGHGVFDETLKEGFVAARNSSLNDKGRTTYIPHSILRQRLDNISCEHIFLMMDVCFGGTLDPEVAKGRNADPYAEQNDKQLIVRKLSKTTRKFLTSGSKEYVSDGIPGKHSPFAAQFIRALKETGGKGNRIMTIYDLVGYFDRLATVPRFGKFSPKDDPISDFVFVARVE